MVAQNFLRTCERKQVFLIFATALDLNNCLKQIKLPIALHICANLILSYHLICYENANGAQRKMRNQLIDSILPDYFTVDI